MPGGATCLPSTSVVCLLRTLTLFRCCSTLLRSAINYGYVEVPSACSDVQREESHRHEFV